MKRRVLWILLAAAVLCGCAYAGISLRSRNDAKIVSVAVYVNGELYMISPLEEGKVLTVQQENGCENVIRLTKDGFYMESANCRNQNCIHQGEVTTENWTKRALQNRVICLPNLVEVVLVTENSDPDVPDI